MLAAQQKQLLQRTNNLLQLVYAAKNSYESSLRTPKAAYLYICKSNTMKRQYLLAHFMCATYLCH
jgi:hypothetical protein